MAQTVIQRALEQLRKESPKRRGVKAALDANAESIKTEIAAGYTYAQIAEKISANGLICSGETIRAWFRSVRHRKSGPTKPAKTENQNASQKKAPSESSCNQVQKEIGAQNAHQLLRVSDPKPVPFA